MPRTILAVLLGYATIAALVIPINFGLAAYFTFGPPTAKIDPRHLPLNYLIGLLIGGLLAAIAGGWVCARIAAHSPRKHGLYLGALVVTMGLVNAVILWGKQPFWVAFLIPLVGFAGVLLGSRLRTDSQGT